MYFIDVGTASAMVRGTEATRLRSGDYFGEMSFMATCRRFLKNDDSEITDTDVIRTADVVATSSCRMMEFSVRRVSCVCVCVVPRRPCQLALCCHTAPVC